MTSEQKEIFNAIDDILYHDWDPISIGNIAPRNEYEKYTTAIFGLLIGGSGIETIAKRLYEIETSTLGVTGSIEHCWKIAEKIVKLR